MNRVKQSPFLFLVAGPGLLFITLILLYVNSAAINGRPVWMCGLVISMFLSLMISFLAFQELRTQLHHFHVEEEKKEKKADNMRVVLDETHRLYQDKVKKLEEANAESEKALKDLEEGYETLHKDLLKAKNQVSAFHLSLEDALDEVRILRHMQYLESQSKAHIPSNLIQQHQQLRDQFEEKSLILDQTRRRLFVIEGHLLALKKENQTEGGEQEQKLLKSLCGLLEENRQLQEEITALESLLNTVFAEKKKTSTKSKKKLEQMLELQFDQ